MGKQQDRSRLISGTVWHLVFRILSTEWVPPLLQAWGLLRSIAAEHRIGLYEVLDFEHELELCDPKGKKAIYRKRAEVRFLQDFVTAYEDQAWGIGNIFADYRCSPGTLVDRYRDGHKYKVLISLRKTVRRGEVMQIRIDRTVHNGFLSQECWSETEVSHRTKHLQLRVIFPRGRFCEKMTVIEKNAGRTTNLDLSQAEQLPDGRQCVTWSKKKPVLFEMYVFRWKW